MTTESGISMYYVSETGLLCITFPSSNSKQPELCHVIGVQNETWFTHEEIK